MQSRLPDVNTAFVKYRNNVHSALKAHDWDTVFGSLYAWNGLLPAMTKDDDTTPKYRITISDIDFEEATKTKSVMICPSCNEKTNYINARIFVLRNSMVVQTLTGKLNFKAWTCEFCKTDNKLLDTSIAESVRKEPFYVGVVPKPPRRRDGLNDRGRYARKVTHWAWAFITELEEKTAQFRDDYKENNSEFAEWDEENLSGKLESDDNG